VIGDDAPRRYGTYDGLAVRALDLEARVAEIRELAVEHHSALAIAEREATFPKAIYREMGRRGLLGAITPQEFGGLGGGAAEYCFIQEEVARHGLVSPQVAIQGQRWILEWGTPEQVRRYLSGIADGSIIFSESISEKNAGSSFKRMTSTARKVGGEWILNGSKTHVNLGADSDVTAFYAIEETGLTSFLVDMDRPGIRVERTDPIGLRLLPTADVHFVDVRVTDDALLGSPGAGLQTFLSVFNLSRLGNASELIGFSRRALTLALDYARQREVGQNVVTDFQGLQWTASNCYADVYAAGLARNRAAMVADNRLAELGLATSIAKKLAVDAAERISTEMFGLVGGHGLYHTAPFAAILHDIKVLRVAGGSIEVLRNYIFKKLLGSDDYLGLR